MSALRIRVGYRIEITTAKPVSCKTLLEPHPSRDGDFISLPKPQVTSLHGGSKVPVREYTDGFGNRCRRLLVLTATSPGTMKLLSSLP